jgi:hypothetical protein
MNRALVILFFFGLFVCGCEKEKESDGNILYGTWVKGSNAGDTLRFYKSNRKNILAYNVSFNAALPVPIETEFIYNRGKLSLKYYGSSDSYYAVDTFKWIRVGEEFEVQGIQLFSFISSTQVHFTYRKVQ